MANSNSNLICSSIPSPYRTQHASRKIDTITIHTMSGNLSIESCGRLFQKKGKNASSNYGIGTDGRIALYVDEKDASWCSSNTPNDERAITIEVANDGGKSTGWHISDTALNSLISLLVDVCIRNDISKLLWENDKSLIGNVSKQNLTLHRWFANKSCPGDYIVSILPKIVESVNERIKAETAKLYRVQVGAYKYKENAIKMQEKLKKLGIPSIIKEC